MAEARVLLCSGWPATLEWEIPVDVLLKYSPASKLQSEVVQLPLQSRSTSSWAKFVLRLRRPQVLGVWPAGR